MSSSASSSSSMSSTVSRVPVTTTQPSRSETSSPSFAYVEDLFSPDTRLSSEQPLSNPDRVTVESLLQAIEQNPQVEQLHTRIDLLLAQRLLSHLSLTNQKKAALLQDFSKKEIQLLQQSEKTTMSVDLELFGLVNTLEENFREGIKTFNRLPDALRISILVRFNTFVSKNENLAPVLPAKKGLQLQEERGKELLGKTLAYEDGDEVSERDG